MDSTVGSYEAKTHLPALLDRVARGETITITKRGKPVAQLVPVQLTKPKIAKVISEMLQLRDKGGPELGADLTLRDLMNEGRRF
jgi:prevent-host-death family protein